MSLILEVCSQAIEIHVNICSPEDVGDALLPKWLILPVPALCSGRRPPNYMSRIAFSDHQVHNSHLGSCNIDPSCFVEAPVEAPVEADNFHCSIVSRNIHNQPYCRISMSRMQAVAVYQEKGERKYYFFS